MEIAAHTPGGYGGVPQSVGKDFAAVFVQDDTVPESAYMYAYWLKQFGFSRGDDMKGIAVITLPYLVTP